MYSQKAIVGRAHEDEQHDGGRGAGGGRGGHDRSRAGVARGCAAELCAWVHNESSACCEYTELPAHPVILVWRAPAKTHSRERLVNSFRRKSLSRLPLLFGLLLVACGDVPAESPALADESVD